MMLRHLRRSPRVLRSQWLRESNTSAISSPEPLWGSLERAPPGALRCQKDSALRSLITRVVACEEVEAEAPAADKKQKGSKQQQQKSPTTTSATTARFFEVELADTVLFPEGGGQPWDTGRIDAAVVDKVYVKDGRCVHRVVVASGVVGGGGDASAGASAGASAATAAAAADAAADADADAGAVLLTQSMSPPFRVGQEVVATVDWARRFDHMQQHSAQHLLSAIAERHGYDTTTWSLGEERSNVELVPLAGTPSSSSSSSSGGAGAGSKGSGSSGGNPKVVPAETLLQIEREVNDAIVLGLAMTPTFATPGSAEWAAIAAKFSADAMPQAMRVVCIDGLDANPCCGTHVQNLAQLQSVRLLNVEAARGATRVWFVAGERVNREFARMFRREQALVKLLSCGPDEHAARVEKLQQAHKASLKELKGLQQELAASVAAELVAQSASAPVVRYHRADGDLAFLQAVLAHVGDARERGVFVLAAGDVRSEGMFVLAGPAAFVVAHGREAAQVIDGKGGGGKNGVFQGKATGLANLDALVARLAELLRSA